jgi:release factor glutamine methyltransferase
MKLVREVVLEITDIFSAHDIRDSKRQAEELLCDLFNCSRLDLYHDRNRSLSDKEWTTCQYWIQCRLRGEPLAYLSGNVQFYGCFIEVNPAVLIPRLETEILVDKVVSSLKKQDLCGKILWDLCCGSGCIGIALKKTFPTLSIYLSDYSEGASILAARNAVANGVNVTCLRGDFLAPFKGSKAHYIVCNPPYISEDEYVMLDKEVKDYEPRLALIGGKTGLEFYQRLAKELPPYLYPHAQVWLEIGYQQGRDVQKIFQTTPWKNQRLENDWADHNRFFFLENE